MAVIWIPVDATENERKTFEEDREWMKAGWSGSFDRLDEYVQDLKQARREEGPDGEDR